MNPAPERSVFILDDEQEFREDLGEFLEGQGYRVATAGDARFFTDADMADHDVLLLDLAMPSIDGMEVLKYLSRHPKAPAVILLSGSGEDVIRTVADAARRDGLAVLGLLHKPFDPQDLLHLLEADASLPTRDKAVPVREPKAVLAALRAALANSSLPVQFQPLVQAETLAFAGAEALLDGTVPGIGFVGPAQILAAAASDSALSLAITQHVLTEAVAVCVRWRALGWDGKVSVNLPIDALLTAGVAGALTGIVQAAGLPTSSVVFELTEDALYIASSEALSALARLRIAGFGLALDDVGQRQSGLLQIANLPVTEIKIDMELLRDARDWGKARSVFQSIADLGHGLQLYVVAEGVETPADLALVRSSAVDLVQGFIVARKMKADDLLALLGQCGDHQSSLVALVGKQ
ncbi:EAL domain-containing response regulator [Aquabacter sp. P-9]|uniref:EAL domain-containing response regulator n=1 Tax=Aquabacter sediminis TaxID=3029197 RepID=UPI00237D52DF|nr:EAL domain-containing response regulator [Aquabacter sp. P-9]MDE1570930.1 EAL domain-containing response regulator [Aquabacter sp. P-9]